VKISNGQWRTILGVLAAVCAYLLATDLHPDVVLPPVASLVLGAILVALAAIKVPEEGTGA
jgi:hypothetical protein